MPTMYPPFDGAQLQGPSGTIYRGSPAFGVNVSQQDAGAALSQGWSFSPVSAQAGKAIKRHGQQAPISLSQPVNAAAATISPTSAGPIVNATTLGASSILIPSVQSFGLSPPGIPNVTRFAITKGAAGVRAQVYPQAGVLTGANISGATAGAFGAGPLGVSFMYYGSACELILYAGPGANQFSLKVNDQYVQALSATWSSTGQVAVTGGGFNYLKLTFPAVDWYRVDYYAGVCSLIGVQIGPNDSIEPAPIRGPRVIVVGDSYTTGTGSTNGQASGLWQGMADALGWDDVWQSGVGGSGYLATGPGVTARQRLATDVIPFSPDIVIWAMGHNDTAFTQAQIQAEAALCYAQLANALPNCQQIVFGYNGSSGVLSSTSLAIETGIQAAANAAGIPFVSEVNQIRNVAQQSGGVFGTTNQALSVGATSFTIGNGGVLSNGSQFQPSSYVQIGTGAAATVVQILNQSGPTINLPPGVTVANTYANGTLITQFGDNLLSGTGKAGTVTGWGNSDLFVISDGTHPSDAGHRYRGRWAALKVAQALGL